MQNGVDKWEAGGFLGMSVEMLDRVYGHHHPEHLRGAAHALGYRRSQSLAITLAPGRRPRQDGQSPGVNCPRNGTFSFTYDLSGSAPVLVTLLPAALPLFATGLGALGLLGWRRKRKGTTYAMLDICV